MALDVSDQITKHVVRALLGFALAYVFYRSLHKEEAAVPDDEQNVHRVSFYALARLCFFSLCFIVAGVALFFQGPGWEWILAGSLLLLPGLPGLLWAWELRSFRALRHPDGLEVRSAFQGEKRFKWLQVTAFRGSVTGAMVIEIGEERVTLPHFTLRLAELCQDLAAHCKLAGDLQPLRKVLKQRGEEAGF